MNTAARRSQLLSSSNAKDVDDRARAPTVAEGSRRASERRPGRSPRPRSGPLARSTTSPARPPRTGPRTGPINQPRREERRRAHDPGLRSVRGYHCGVPVRCAGLRACDVRKQATCHRRGSRSLAILMERQPTCAVSNDQNLVIVLNHESRSGGFFVIGLDRVRDVQPQRAELHTHCLPRDS
jgi:hypothetical protein